MKFRSTRAKAAMIGISDALEAGLAPDGGLYVPEAFPEFFSPELGKDQSFSQSFSMKEAGQTVLPPFFNGDPILEEALPGICQRAFDFPVPLRQLDEDTAVLELFHGPTAAFKDVGARFLAECVSVLARARAWKRTVLVATSGDTGGAVAGAFFGKPDVEVRILYPLGKISPRQQKQLTCWGGNIHAYAVHGDFDDCQRMVKEAFQSPEWRRDFSLISANSINLGRILPQSVYYAMASLRYLARTGERPGFIVPSGNVGNATAALWAKRMGFPIRQVVLACNANRSIPDYLGTGKWKPADTVATLANAMDVGNPSNMERILDLYPTVEELRRDVQAYSVSDEEIRETIRGHAAKNGEIYCPHTATAVFVRESLKAPHWIVVATAHPAKFESIVEPLVGRAVPVPPALAELLDRRSVFTEVEPELRALREAFVG